MTNTVTADTVSCQYWSMCHGLNGVISAVVTITTKKLQGNYQ